MDWDQIPDSTPIDDISGLRIKATTRKEVYEAEAANISIAYIKYLGRKPTERMAPFDMNWVLKLHKEMFGEVWKWAGTVRTADATLGMQAHQIRPALLDLLNDLFAWKEHDMPLIEQAAHLHHRAVHIHPFRDGNGRWSRLLANIWLKRWDAELIEWPEIGFSWDTTERRRYVEAIRLADNGQYDALLELHREYHRQG